MNRNRLLIVVFAILAVVGIVVGMATVSSDAAPSHRIVSTHKNDIVPKFEEVVTKCYGGQFTNNFVTLEDASQAEVNDIVWQVNNPFLTHQVRLVRILGSGLTSLISLHNQTCDIA